MRVMQLNYHPYFKVYQVQFLYNFRFLFRLYCVCSEILFKSSVLIIVAWFPVKSFRVESIEAIIFSTEKDFSANENFQPHSRRLKLFSNLLFIAHVTAHFYISNINYGPVFILLLIANTVFRSFPPSDVIFHCQFTIILIYILYKNTYKTFGTVFQLRKLDAQLLIINSVLTGSEY